MAVRPSMAYIITAVRELINDPSGPDEKFSDQQIQDKLDLKRLDLYNHCMKAADTVMPNGRIEWHDFYANKHYWETDYVIQQVDGASSTPTTAEPLIGRFTYATNQTVPLMITGRIYNIYGVAVSLLTTWVAELRSQISSWTADGTTITRIGQIADMNRLIRMYASEAWAWGNSSQVKLVRKDLKN